MQLIDNYQRRFQYLRLSLTERCNFQCQYCLPNGYQVPAEGEPHFLSLSEIGHLVDAFCELGVKKIRLTGGEPTLRKDFTDIVALIRTNPAVEFLAITTNGARLAQKAQQWRDAGVDGINISIDSFRPNTFQLITGQDRLQQVLDGVDAALSAGFKSVKINTVLMKGLNDQLQDYLDWIQTHPVELRFIELMEMSDNGDFFNRWHVSGAQIEQQLLQQGWQLQVRSQLSGPAKVYAHPDYQGRIGLIMPYSKGFCEQCNRLRVSARGKFHFCLFGEQGIELRDLLQNRCQRAQLQQRVLDGLTIKPVSHYLQQHRTGVIQNLSQLGG